MSGFVQTFNAISRMAGRTFMVGATVICTGTSGLAEAPKRVVSMNLCTDLLAMMLADEGQLLSVSAIALDENVSSMAQRARSLQINNGQAEDVFLMQPDLVLAGIYTPPTTLNMLKTLGIRVEVFDIETSLDGVRDQVKKMGAALHREKAANALIADFDARRAALKAEVGPRPSALLYHPSGYTSGIGSLSHEILELAGFRNAADEAGYTEGTRMPLEVLALTDPDLVITSMPYPGGSRAEDVMRHPVVQALKDSRVATANTNHDWVCDTPFVIRAAEQLATVRRAIIGESQ